jgi:hypothetical protein
VKESDAMSPEDREALKNFALGLAVPKMPIGSPGMDGPEYQGRRDPYEVLLIQKDGSSSVFSSYN